MAKPRIFDPNSAAEAAAFLRAESGLSQAEIGRVLGVSQAAVSRLLRHARGLGCYREVAQFVRGGTIDDERMQQLEGLLEHSDLAAALASVESRNNVRVRSVRIFDSGSTDASPASIDQRQKRFGTTAALRIAERLRAASIAAVTWGSTLSKVMDGLAGLGYPWPVNSLRRVLPVSAEPMRFAHNEFTSSTLARRLSDIMNSGHASQVQPLALTGVPAFIPKDLSRMIPETRRLPQRLRGDLPRLFRRFFEENSTAYKKIFVGPDALIHQVEVLVTSVGTAEKPMGFCNDDLLRFSGVRSDELRRLVVGDIGGVMLPSPGLSTRDTARVAALNAMWTGIQRTHLEAIARRAQEGGLPGVVLIAMGASRSTVVREVLLQGLCSELIIDRDLATALSDQVAIRTPRTRKAKP